MEYTQKMNDNIMIGTAVLSALSEKKHTDSIDLMLPIVKYAIQDKYSIGDEVSAELVCDYIQTEFAFQELPLAIINKAMNRLCKKSECLSYNNKKFVFSGDVSSDYSNIKNKRIRANMLIDSITQQLTLYINDRITFKQFSNEDTKKALFNFLDKYGLSTLQDSLIEPNIAKSEHINRIIGDFVLDENKKNSNVFNDLIELIKGIFISKAFYLQTNNDNFFKARLHNTTIILDAPVLLSILGLKTNGENRIAKEFLQSIPVGVNLNYFPHNLQELEFIINNYKNQRILGGKFSHTLEYFDETFASIEDIDEFCIQINKKLRDLKITEYSKDIPINVEHNIDVESLSTELKDKIPSYKTKESALDNDLKTISYINRIRNGHSAATIEDCKAILITNNKNLVRVVNGFKSNISTVAYAMTITDFTILMWLKSGKKNDDVPKQLLVANAIAATEEITENLMESILAKIKKYEDEGCFDSENVGLILENIYCRRELADICNGDPDELTPDKISIVQKRYEDRIRKEAGYDTQRLQNELQLEKRSRVNAEQNEKQLKSDLINKATTKATKYKNITNILLFTLVGIIIIGVAIFGIVACCYQGINGKVSVWGIIALAFSILGVLDFLVSKFRLIIKLIRKISNTIYSRVYDKKISEYFNSNGQDN